MGGAKRLTGNTAKGPDAREPWDGRPVRVRMLVAASGLGQVEVAARLGVDPRTLRRWMSDEKGLPIGYGDLCNLERLVAFRLRAQAAAEGRRRRRAGQGEAGV